VVEIHNFARSRQSKVEFYIWLITLPLLTPHWLRSSVHNLGLTQHLPQRHFERKSPFWAQISTFSHPMSSSYYCTSAPNQCSYHSSYRPMAIRWDVLILTSPSWSSDAGLHVENAHGRWLYFDSKSTHVYVLPLTGCFAFGTVCNHWTTFSLRPPSCQVLLLAIGYLIFVCSHQNNLSPFWKHNAMFYGNGVKFKNASILEITPFLNLGPFHTCDWGLGTIWGHLKPLMSYQLHSSTVTVHLWCT
jgi:hypothetical protein